MRPTPGRTRVAVGAALIAVAVVGNLVLYSSAAETRPVVQAVRDIPAGSMVSIDDLRSVPVGAVDPSVRVLDGHLIPSLVGTFARTRIVSGSLLVEQNLQEEPLVAAGSVVVARSFPAGEIPNGLRERSRVEIVLSPDRQQLERIEADIRAGLAVGADLLPPTIVISGTIAALPTEETSVLGEQSISVEVDHADAHLVVAHPDPRLILLPPIGADGA